MKSIKLFIIIIFLPLWLFSQKKIEGLCTFYHDKFIGRRTATGEIFRQNKLTAASNIFKLGSTVKVTNLFNNKSVIVRINDVSAKWTVGKGRLIDLSKSAARLIGMEQLQLVRLELL